MRVSWRRLAAGCVLLAAGGVLTVPGTAAAAGDGHFVYGWGANMTHLLGNPVGDPRSPVAMPALGDDVTQFAITRTGNIGHALALRSDGTVWAWGANAYGELGNGTKDGDGFAPARVPGLPAGILQVAVGGTHSLALAPDGSVWAWGSNAHGELGTAPQQGVPNATRVPGVSGVTQLAAGSGFSVALRGNGEVWTWGANSVGQLGDGTYQDRFTPARNKAVYGMTEISGGAFSVLARRPGSVWAWGNNSYGQLGTGSVGGSSAVPVLALRDDNVAALAAGAIHALVLDRDGSYWGWGANYNGELGTGESGGLSPTPRHVLTSGLTSISAGWAENVAVRADGKLLVWGFAADGLLGDGTSSQAPITVPTPVAAVTNVVQATVGNETVLVRATAAAIPNVAGAAKISAEAALKSFGLTVSSVAVPDTTLCNNVGIVKTQTPPPGTVLARGGKVTLQVWDAPPAGCK